MILSGWKEIAHHLRCGVRSAQRWERLGLPIKRLSGSRRGIVIADSEQLDSWRRYNAFWRTKNLDILANVERAKQLRKEIREAVELLRSRREALRKELGEIRGKRRKKSPSPERSKRHEASHLTTERKRGI